MTENEISYKIRGCIFKVFKTLGPGLFETVYERVLEHELTKSGLEVKVQHPIPIRYDNLVMDVGFRADILVENKVLIEIKAIENLTEVHHKQVITYLKLTELKLGILINFNCAKIEEGIFRKVNGL